MRTTIEIKPEHRARIMELAAARRQKGFSAIIAEALDLYLESERTRKKAVKAALSLKGSISEAEADSWLAETRKIRANWRWS